MDVELNLSPFERVRVREQNGEVENTRPERLVSAIEVLICRHREWSAPGIDQP